jgi:hypothetical protein
MQLQVLLNPVAPIACSGRDVLWAESDCLAAFLTAAVPLEQDLHARFVLPWNQLVVLNVNLMRIGLVRGK